jgi:hypothetical protein
MSQIPRASGPRRNRGSRLQQRAQPLWHRLVGSIAVEGSEHILAVGFAINESANPAIDQTSAGADNGLRIWVGHLQIMSHLRALWLVHGMRLVVRKM